ncbi:MAG: ATP-binding protein, partial [Bacteroidota bacterium]
WKLFVLITALVIAGITILYSNNIASKIRTEEQLKVKLWSEAIQKRAELVVYTQSLFESLREEENKKADLLVQAYDIVKDPPKEMDLTFVSNVMWSNKTIPLLFYNKKDSLTGSLNLPPERRNDLEYIDSLKNEMIQRNPPIIFDEGDVEVKIYYNESGRFSELKSVMQDLINSFISETVINSASVPVILTDSSRQNVIRLHQVDSALTSQPAALQSRLKKMAAQNDPIAIDLPDQGTHYIYYEDSVLLTQLQYFPLVQLVLIGVFLLVAYLIFSTFRKAEQNQVWVGMAKETAHQLGTPLSSLMAWVSLLEAQGVDEATIKELNKDLDRLGMITDRFSKIGSKPDLQPNNVEQVVREMFEYLRTRISGKIAFEMNVHQQDMEAGMNPPLFGWVLENLVKNAADAMGGEGRLQIDMGRDGPYVYIDVTDTGKGISKSQQSTVFQPGFTTKKRGWGLGLSLTKRIIEQYHGGKIFVLKSEVGKGTTFRILLNIA